MASVDRRRSSSSSTISGYSVAMPLQRTRSFRASRRKSTLCGQTSVRAYEIRQQLTDQLKCLDQRFECQQGMVLELMDFFRKRAEVEMEYSKGLDRISKNFMAKHKAEKQKRDQWSQYSTFPCWTHLVSTSRKQSRDHATMSDIYGVQMTQRLQETVDDLRRIFSNCRDIGFGSHDDLGKVLGDLQTEMKSYHIMYGESKQAEEKLRIVETQQAKVEAQTSKTSKKTKSLEKMHEKKLVKHTDAKVKAVKARNEYLISIDATNASLHKYFIDDFPLLIDCMELGFHNSMQRNMMMYKSCLEAVQKSAQSTVEGVTKCVQDLEPAKDKQAFVDHNSATFTLPKKFEFMPHKGDMVQEVSAEAMVQTDLQLRYSQIHKRLEQEKLESEEVWKSVEAADRALVAMIHQNDYEVGDQFADSTPSRSPGNSSSSAVGVPGSLGGGGTLGSSSGAAVSGGQGSGGGEAKPEIKRKRLETEKYYFEKFALSISKSNQIARMTAKYDVLKCSLDKTGWAKGGGGRPPSFMPVKNMRPQPRRLGKTPVVGQLKVFGTNLVEYIEATKQEIPVVVLSCIRAIKEFGMHHEGVFRISGLQSEINDMKNAFEKGVDPLADIEDGNSINSIAAVLKLFFRELQEPLFPQFIFDALIECNQKSNASEAVSALKELLNSSLGPERKVVMRYLFAFLNHLSEKYDENLMQPYNLAVCFGPTLLPIPADKDQVIYQNNVNETIKLIIIHQDKIFSREAPGPMYEKVTRVHKTDGENDMSDDEDINQDEEETDVIEAVAVYPFKGRTDKELSFKKGDHLLLFKRVTTDWWEGAFNGKEGMVPDNYVTRKSDYEAHDHPDRGAHLRRSLEPPANASTVGVSKPSSYRGSSSAAGEATPIIIDKSPSQPNLQHPSSSSLAPSTSSSAMAASMSAAAGSTAGLGSSTPTDKTTASIPPSSLPVLSSSSSPVFTGVTSSTAIEKSDAESVSSLPVPSASVSQSPATPLDPVPESALTSSVENDLVNSLQELSNLTQSINLGTPISLPSATSSSTPPGDVTTTPIAAVSSFTGSAASHESVKPAIVPPRPALSSTFHSQTAASSAPLSPSLRSAVSPSRFSAPMSSSVGPTSGVAHMSPRDLGARSQPDLVIDLPDAGRKGVALSSKHAVGGPGSDTADTFANTEQNTVIRNTTAKSASMPRNIAQSGIFAGGGKSPIFPGGVAPPAKRSASAKTRDGKPMAVAEPIPHDVIRSGQSSVMSAVFQGPRVPSPITVSPGSTPVVTPSGTPVATPTDAKSFDMDVGGARSKPSKVPPPTKSKPNRLPTRPKKFPDGATHF